MSQEDASPIIVRIIEEPTREPGIVDVLVGAMSLTVAILLLAFTVGLVFGGLFILYRFLRPPTDIKADHFTR